MDQTFKQIILVTDALSTSRAATETAFNLARQNEAKVLIVDTLREPSSISQWISSNASDVFEMVLADKQKRLESIASRFYEAGIEAKSEVLFGKTSQAITRAAFDNDADLVVRYMKGIRSRFPGTFGNTSRNLMRICPCPVLFVNEKPIDEPTVLACINAEHDTSENEAILRISEALVTDSDKLHGVYCWDLHGKEIMQGHVSKESIESLLNESERVHKSIFDKSLEKTELGKFAGKIRLENGELRDVIPQFCRDESIDVVVMCSASLNHPIHRYLGSTIESVLDELPCSLLVVKPDGFKSPVKASQATVEVVGR